jgi:hypothetical protein
MLLLVISLANSQELSWDTKLKGHNGSQDKKAGQFETFDKARESLALTLQSRRVLLRDNSPEESILELCSIASAQWQLRIRWRLHRQVLANDEAEVPHSFPETTS